MGPPRRKTTNLVTSSHVLSAYSSRPRRFNSHSISFGGLLLLALLLIWLRQRNQAPPAHQARVVPGHLRSPNLASATSNITSDRYLSYLPHSGFHNQRIALENALTLAVILNRTLVVPPCLLGAAVPFIEFDKLARRLWFISSEGFEHCASQDLPSRECLGAFKEAWIDWKELIDLKQALRLVKVIERDSFSQTWLYRTLNITQPELEVYQLKDKGKYQYRFLINTKKEVPKSGLEKFEEWIDVRQRLLVGHQDTKLIELGSLFGSGRLKIVNDPVVRQIRSEFRRLMIFRQPILVNLSRQIATQIGGSQGFYAVHIRLGDNLFRADSEQKVSELINQLIDVRLGLSRESFERALIDPEPKLKPYQQPATINTLTCRGALHTDTSLALFNRPLFIATDAPIPTIEPTLKSLFKAFPCTHLLSDFDLRSLEQIRNPKNHAPVGMLTVPFVDAMVAAQAVSVVGTAGSTFSRFVTDVLFRTYHNLSIIERG